MKPKFLFRKKIDHIFTMTSRIGFYQFAEKTVPNEKFGYSLDDQTRALILALFLYQKEKKEKYLDLAKIYLNFIKRAQRPDGYFHNFADSKGRFIDQIGSQDSFGRAIWALGFCQRYGPEALRKKAEKIFAKAKAKIKKLRYIRSKAYASLGLAEIYQKEKNKQTKKELEAITRYLLKKFKENSSGRWNFFEKKLIYANAILPYALLSSYYSFKDEECKKVGLKALNFLNRVCRFKNKPAPIGNQGWYERGGKKALLDPQPIEAGDMVLAAVLAYELTGQKKYRQMAKEWFAWFFGNNIYSLIFYDQKTGGCHDGIRHQKLNPDEGAESTILFHLANLAIEKIK